jgi:hypothetical protein
VADSMTKVSVVSASDRLLPRSRFYKPRPDHLFARSVAPTRNAFIGLHVPIRRYRTPTGKVWLWCGRESVDLERSSARLDRSRSASLAVTAMRMAGRHHGRAD